MKYAKYKGFTVNVLNITIRNMEMNWLKLCHMTNNRNMLYHQGTHTASIRVRLQLMHLRIRKNETVFYEKWQTITKLLHTAVNLLITIGCGGRILVGRTGGFTAGFKLNSSWLSHKEAINRSSTET